MSRYILKGKRGRVELRHGPADAPSPFGRGRERVHLPDLEVFVGGIDLYRGPELPAGTHALEPFPIHRLSLLAWPRHRSL